MKIPRLLSLLSAVTVFAPPVFAAPSPLVPAAGIRENTPRIQALVVVGTGVQPPKDATVVDLAGDTATHVLKAWIDEREVDLNDRQKTLHEKYREKYRRLGSPTKSPTASTNP